MKLIKPLRASVSTKRPLPLQSLAALRVSSPAGNPLSGTLLLSTPLLALLCLLTGCAAGPDYHAPAPLAQGQTLPAQFKEGLLQAAEPGLAASDQAWWQRFGDPILNQLMEKLPAANQNLAAAQARYRQATQASTQAQAAQWPSIAANAGASKARNSPSGSSNSFNLGLSANWEADVWGKVARSVEAANASQQASAMDLAALQLSLQAQLASSYSSLRILDAQIALLNQSTEAYQRSLTLTQKRYAGGIVSRADVLQAETQWQSAKAQVLDAQLQRSNLEHAIAILLGQPPANFSLAAQAQPTMQLPVISAPVPAQMLQRRPDIAAAERRMAASNAQIGIASAAFFPSLSLSATSGFRGSSLADLISLPNRVWSVGPALATTLFDAGSRRAATDQAIASYDQSVATYRQNVLGALQEAEDNLAAQAILAQEAQEQQLAVKAAEHGSALALNQYKAGTVSYLNVVIAQTTELSAQRSALSILGQRYAASINLVKALGGGW